MLTLAVLVSVVSQLCAYELMPADDAYCKSALRDVENAYQKSDYVHPFTSETGGDLIATPDGWVETVGGPVVQNWAHKFMCRWSGK